MSTTNFYIHFEGIPEDSFKVKWDKPDAPVSELIQHFTTTYNKKHQKDYLPSKFTLRKRISDNDIDENKLVKDIVEDGDDIYAMEKKVTCGRCGKSFLESENNDTACKFHPGPPIFHDAYKGWKCCERKTIDFEEFLAFETCAVGRHIPKTDKPKPTPSEQTQAPTNIQVVSNNSGVEVYRDTTTTSKPSNPTPAAAVEEPVPIPKETPDPPDAVIPKGAPCLHRGCKRIFVDDSSRKEECIYHPGNPVFHEGSKGYSCCKKMTLIFEEFLSMEGCSFGVHKFVPEPKVEATVSVRHDFYQMGNNVIVTFYSKNCDKSASHVTFTPISMNVNLKLSDGQIFSKVIEFTGGKTIDPAASTFSVMGTKVEVKLRKASPSDPWVKL
jgi:hypothetical protein